MAHVQVSLSSSGYLPTLYWGTGEDMDREAYSMAYDDLNVAERIARSWADGQGAEYRAYQKPATADPRFAPLVRRLREDEGLDLRGAITRAQALLAAEPAA